MDLALSKINIHTTYLYFNTQDNQKSHSAIVGMWGWAGPQRAEAAGEKNGAEWRPPEVPSLGKELTKKSCTQGDFLKPSEESALVPPSLAF